MRPGARPADIRLAYAGASGLTLDDPARSLIETEMGALRDSAPVSYQMIDGAPRAGREPLCAETGDAADALRVRRRRVVPARIEN